MSHFNLLPWREQLRARAMRRWRWGVCLACLMSSGTVFVLHQLLSAWYQPVRLQMQARQQAQTELETALAEQSVWQARQQQVAQVQRDWAQWQAQQAQAWQVLQQVLSLSPHGIQLERLGWRDQQVQLSGWAISPAHVQAWQDALQAQHTEMQALTWRENDGLACRQQRFVLQWRSPGGSA